MWDTHWSGLEVFIREAPLVPVVLIVDQILLHDLVILVKEQVADSTRGCVLQIIHCNQREEARQVRAMPCSSWLSPPMEARNLTLLQSKTSEGGQGTA